MHELYGSTLGWLWQGLMLFLLLGLATGLVVGMGLLLAPRTMLALDARVSAWVDTRSLQAALDETISVEHQVYRHHRIVGTVIILGAGFVLWQWSTAYDHDAALAVLAPSLRPLGLDWLLSGLEWSVVLIHVVALVLGAVVLLRPSLLKGLESSANRWVSEDGLARALDRDIGGLGAFAERHPRAVGGVIAALALACLVVLVPVAGSGLFG